MSSHFKVKKVTELAKMKDGDILPESSLSLKFNDGAKFIQFDHVPAKDRERGIKVKPGIFEIGVSNGNLILLATEFTQETSLNDYSNTEGIINKINNFFAKLDVYKKHNIFPKRGFLLYGPPGCSKSHSISKICTEYAKNKDTMVLLWKTASFDPDQVSMLLKTFDYGKKVKKLVLVAEDIGGNDVYDVQSVRRVDSNLLALLDNVESTFKIPTVILATTNFPQNLLESLTDRPSRFDVVVKFDKPTAEFRAKFLEFFGKGAIDDALKKDIYDKKYECFSIAHIKEIVIRAEIEGIGYAESMQQVLEQSQKVTRAFEDNQKKMGF